MKGSVLVLVAVWVWHSTHTKTTYFSSAHIFMDIIILAQFSDSLWESNLQPFRFKFLNTFRWLNLIHNSLGIKQINFWTVHHCYTVYILKYTSFLGYNTRKLSCSKREKGGVYIFFTLSDASLSVALLVSFTFMDILRHCFKFSTVFFESTYLLLCCCYPTRRPLDPRARVKIWPKEKLPDPGRLAASRWQKENAWKHLC